MLITEYLSALIGLVRHVKATRDFYWSEPRQGNKGMEDSALGLLKFLKFPKY